jgi:hypothetical protein
MKARVSGHHHVTLCPTHLDSLEPRINRDCFVEHQKLRHYGRGTAVLLWIMPTIPSTKWLNYPKITTSLQREGFIGVLTMSSLPGKAGTYAELDIFESSSPSLLLYTD